MAGRNAEVKELIKEIRAQGFSVASGGKHNRVLDPKGKLGPRGAVVRDKDGPVIISSTPGDANWRDTAEGRLRRAGVLPAKKGPMKPKGARGEENGEETLTREERERAQKLARQTAAKDVSRERHERTMQLRARLEPLVTQVGGWNAARGPASSGVQLHELGLIAELWSQRLGTAEMFASTEAAARSAKILREGGTLSDQRVAVWEALAEDWGSADNPRAWYFERLREARGLPPDWRVKMGAATSTLPEPVDEDSQIGEVPLSSPPASERPVEEPSAAVLRPAALASLPGFERAMRAVFLMSRGADGDDWEEILEFATLIASYEAGKEGAE